MIHLDKSLYPTRIQNIHHYSLVPSQSQILSPTDILHSYNLPETLAKVELLYVFLQIKIIHFYQLEYIIQLDSWEKYIIKEAELEDMHEISNV